VSMRVAVLDIWCLLFVFVFYGLFFSSLVWLVTFVTEVSLRLAAPRTGGALYRRYLASRLALSSPDLFSSAPTTLESD